MNDTLALALIASGGALLLILFIAVIIFVCTYHVNIYKSFKKPVKTMGIIDEARYVHDPHGGEAHYLITYSYTDNGVVRRTNAFKWLQNIGKASDKLRAALRQSIPAKRHRRLSVKVREKSLVEGTYHSCGDKSALSVLRHLFR